MYQCATDVECTCNNPTYKVYISAISEISQDLSSETPLFCADSTQMPGRKEWDDNFTTCDWSVVSKDWLSFDTQNSECLIFGVVRLIKSKLLSETNVYFFCVTHDLFFYFNLLHHNKSLPTLGFWSCMKNFYQEILPFLLNRKALTVQINFYNSGWF